MNDKTLNRILFIFGFLALFFYFGLIHPLVPFDTDDWMNLTISRPLYPSLQCWNPTKVFPERLEPAVVAIAARYIAPVIGDYVNALILANALVISFFISSYLYLAQRLLTNRFRLSLPCSFCIVVIFALLHFYILKTKEVGNDYLWYAEDSNCYYHYIASNMLNACLVLWLMRHDVKKLMNGWRIFFLVIATYFALCSNLYSTVILIAYIGATLFYELFECDKNANRWLVLYIRRHAYYLIVLLLWWLIQLIEMNGKRANTYGHLEDSMFDFFPQTVQALFTIHFNFGVIAFVTLALVGAKAQNILGGDHKILHIGKRQIIILLAAFLSLVYLVLLSSEVNPDNIQKGQIIFSWIFFLLLLSLLCFGYLCFKIKSIRYLMPLAILLVIFNIRNLRTEFLGVQGLWGISEYECIDYDRAIIDQVRHAEALGQDSVVIRVPKLHPKGNWPLSLDCDFAVGKTLFKHRVVRRRLKTSFIIDEQLTHL